MRRASATEAFVSRAYNRTMGMFQVKVRVSNPADPARFFEDLFRVDTGALYSFIPEDRLESIGISSFGERALALADGRTDRRRIGMASFEVEGHGERVPCYVIFAPKGSLQLVGATTLEGLGVTVDPVEPKLKPILAIIGGYRASI